MKFNHFKLTIFFLGLIIIDAAILFALYHVAFWLFDNRVILTALIIILMAGFLKNLFRHIDWLKEQWGLINLQP